MLSRRSLIVLTSLASMRSAFGSTDSKWKPDVNFAQVTPPIATKSNGKTTVIEFFWYGCPHCYTLDPHLVLWDRYKPDNVEVQFVPVAWQESRVAHSRLHFALSKLGRLDIHGVVFDTIHRGRNRLDSIESQLRFIEEHKIDAGEYRRIYNSPEVTKKIEEANALAKSYRIAGVPSVAIDGRFTSDLGRAGNERDLIKLATDLIRRTR